MLLQNDSGDMYTDSTSPNLEAELTELRPFTEYTISVVPFNQNGMGDPSNEIKIKTFSSTPSEPPSNVTLEVTSSTVSVMALMHPMWIFPWNKDRME